VFRRVGASECSSVEMPKNVRRASFCWVVRVDGPSEATRPLDWPAINKERRTVEDKEGEREDLERDFDRELDR
jgi:hypothetical protein